MGKYEEETKAKKASIGYRVTTLKCCDTCRFADHSDTCMRHEVCSTLSDGRQYSYPLFIRPTGLCDDWEADADDCPA